MVDSIECVRVVLRIGGLEMRIWHFFEIYPAVVVGELGPSAGTSLTFRIRVWCSLANVRMSRIPRFCLT
jgi:hypothetical protein